MKIIVCIKQVPDTNEIRLDAETGTLIREGVPAIINHDDKAGLEAGLRMKDEYGAHVLVMTMGPPQADLAIREALAMGADEGVLITDRAFAGADTWATSSTLASAINQYDYDLIITGRQAIDGDTAQVGPQLAESLGIVNISYVEKINIEGDSVVVRRQYEDRYHIIKAKMPCLITVLSELNEPRYMTPGGIFRAYRDMEVKTLVRNDLDVAEENIGLKGSPTRVVKSFAKSIKGQGTVVTLDEQESAMWMVDRLKEKFIL